MYNTSLRIVNDTAEAEDIMQEGFLKAFSKIDSFRENSTFGAWLKRIVVNLSISVHNKKAKLKEVVYKDELNNEMSYDFTFHHQQENMETENVNKLLETLNSLKDNYRIALSLYFIEGYDYEEMGTILNLSYANCRTTVSRAKESLRKKMLADGR
ncbi:RNA polymerase sigma-70 factor, ECF subfamily [Salegentibacter echinorum]|uniref:RNA polymerase sigma-70 factor, ECF subfamily n=2 Tax=Salegentibacter echinorum TaxID=1073325 RepID=A0A1M5CCW2_SALEC|nr:RNA polymerase sigma-70 factor, ECF subfamily [Salegentibacter echinorum]